MVRGKILIASAACAGLLLADAARVQKINVAAEEAEDLNASLLEFPPLPPLPVMARYCPALAAGTLVVECHSADGLDKQDWFSKSDPYCNVMVTDESRIETRGWRGKEKAMQVSERFKTRTIDNDHSPEWKEAFNFHVRCPHMHNQFRLEVIVKNDNMIHDTTLGRNWIPMNELKGDDKPKKRTLELKQGSGTVTLTTLWCPLGPEHAECLNQFDQMKMSSGSFPKHSGQDVVDCDQGCHKYMTKKAEDEVSAIVGAVNAAQNAARREEHADRMEDMYDDLGDNAEEQHGEEAREREDHFDDLEDHWDDVGDQAEDDIKRYWKQARGLARNLPGKLGNVATQHCGPAFSAELRETARGVNALFAGKKFKGGRRAETGLEEINKRIKAIEKSMERAMRSEGEMVAWRQDRNIPGECSAAFQTHTAGRQRAK